MHIARKLGIPGAEVYVVSFTHILQQSQGKHTISVCMGTACFVKGADKVLEKFKEHLGIESNEVTDDGFFMLKDVRCLGTCGLAPVVMVDDKVFGKVKENDVDGIIKTYRS